MRKITKSYFPFFGFDWDDDVQLEVNSLAEPLQINMTIGSRHIQERFTSHLAFFTICFVIAYAAKLMKLHPPKATDSSHTARLAHAGIVPGMDFNYQSLDVTTRKAIDGAPAQGMKMMHATTHKLGSKVNGWQMLLGTFGSYGIEYLQRGAVAFSGLGCNQTADAVYPQLLTDAGGRPLTGANQYVMHFDKDELPPASAFWSFTLYDKDGFAVPNPLNRANLASWMGLNYSADGSIDLYFQVDSPGKDKETNWLPAPKGGFWVVFRTYGPGKEILEQTWEMPGLVKVK